MKQTSTNTPQNKCGKRNGLFLRLASLLLVFLTSAGAWAQDTETLVETTATFDSNSSGVKSSDKKSYTSTEDNITMVLVSNNGLLQISNRFVGIKDPKGDGSLTFTSVAGNIKSISIEHERFKVDKDLVVTPSSGKYTAPSSETGTATWTDIDAKTAKLTFTGGNADIRATKFVVTYMASPEQLSVEVPTLSASDKFTTAPYTFTITNNEDGATVYYTLDGTDPTPDQADVAGKTGHFTGASSNVEINATTFVKAMAAIKYSDGVYSKSKVVQAQYVYIDGNTFVVAEKDLSLYKSGSAVKKDNITMTFGGLNGTYTKFGKTSSSEDELGLNGVLSTGFGVCDNSSDCLTEGFRDATDKEKGDDGIKNKKWRILHQKSLTPAQLPAYGSYYKFEPRVNGALRVFVEQQGMLNQVKGSEDPDFTQVRLRPVYFIDENGVSQKAYHAATTSILNWDIQSIDRNEIAEDDKHYTKEQMQDIYDMYYAYFNDNNMKPEDVRTPNPILVLHSNGEGVTTFGNTNPTTEDYTKLPTFWPALQKVQKDVYPDDYYNDGTGYFIPTEGYVTYAFNVEAGKTYYLYGVRTKLALTGFQFVPSNDNEESSAEAVTLENASTNAEKLASLDQTKHYDVTVNRTFKKGEWTSLVLPFNVSTQALHSALGAEDNATTSGDIVEASAIKDVDVLNFTEIARDTLFTTKHFNQMIIAGTPVFIRANRDVENPVFKNVIITKTAVDPVSDKYGYTLTGSYDKGIAPQYSFVLVDGANFQQYAGTKGYALDAMSAWITGATSQKTLSMNVIGGNGEGGTTGIVNVENDFTAVKVASDAVYNLNGQKLGKTLPKGVYIKGGKKYIK